MIVYRTVIYHFGGNFDGPIFKSERAARSWTEAAAISQWGENNLVAWDRRPGESADRLNLKLAADLNGGSIGEVIRSFLI